MRNEVSANVFFESIVKSLNLWMALFYKQKEEALITRL